MQERNASKTPILYTDDEYLVLKSEDILIGRPLTDVTESVVTFKASIYIEETPLIFVKVRKEDVEMSNILKIIKPAADTGDRLHISDRLYDEIIEENMELRLKVSLLEHDLVIFSHASLTPVLECLTSLESSST